MVSVQTIHPGEFTFEDLDALPDDGLQYELVDGMLLVTPAPFPLHQRAVMEIAYLLRHVCPPELEVFVAPLDFRPTSRRSLQPDVLVVRREDVGPKNIQRPPLLAVEVLSDSTRSKDRLLKRSLYADAGIPAYWIFDTEVPELTVLRLDGDKYVEHAVVSGSSAYEADLPYPVRLVPDDIIR
jgi:Uma2 family endonuclease